MSLITGNFVRVQSSWTTGNAFTGVEAAGFDQRCAQLVNGDTGSVHAPATSIVIDSGSGGVLLVEGPALVSNGATLSTVSGARVSMQGATDWERLGPNHAGRTRKLFTPLVKGMTAPAVGGRAVFELGGYAAVANKVITLTNLTNSVQQQVVSAFHLEVHSTGTIASVTVTYRAVLGAPQARVIRVDTDGSVTPLTSVAAGADANGWVTAPAVDTTVSVQTWVIPVDGGADPANAIVSRTDHADYALQIREDQSNTGDSSYPYTLVLLLPVVAASTADLNLDSPPNPVVIDGYTVVGGEGILLKDQDDPTENGLYLAPAPGSPWRGLIRGDMANFGLRNGWAVFVQDKGTVNVATYWQYLGQTISPAQIGQAANTWGTIPDNPIANALGTFVPQGNVYIGALVTHTGITSLEWQ